MPHYPASECLMVVEALSKRNKLSQNGINLITDPYRVAEHEAEDDGGVRLGEDVAVLEEDAEEERGESHEGEAVHEPREPVHPVPQAHHAHRLLQVERE